MPSYTLSVVRYPPANSADNFAFRHSESSSAHSRREKLFRWAKLFILKLLIIYHEFRNNFSLCIFRIIQNRIIMAVICLAILGVIGLIIYYAVK